MALENILAILFDFDFTLSAEYMQDALFRKYNVDSKAFWEEKRQLVEKAKQRGINYDDECAYLNLMLRYVREGQFPKLSNTELRELGKDIKLYDGLPDFLPRLQEKITKDPHYAPYNICLEFYVISSGLKEMVLGSPVGPYLTGVFGSEFMEDDTGVIAEIARTIGFVKKTEFIFHINKGANVNPDINVNGRLPHELRRVPFENMIYIGDGANDVPCFAMLSDRGGKSVAVYNPDPKSAAFQQAYELQKDKRLFTFAPADYREGCHTSLVIEHMLRDIIQENIEEQEEEIRRRGSAGPKHLA